jgi:hypothetical protein
MAKEVTLSNGLTGWEQTGFHFLQRVNTPNGEGLVQGILFTEGQSLQIIISHNPKTLPTEMVPEPCFWKLMYYEPKEVIPI